MERELEKGRRKGVRQTEGNGKWKMCGNAAQKGISNFETCSKRITERARERGKDREDERALGKQRAQADSPPSPHPHV